MSLTKATAALLALLCCSRSGRLVSGGSIDSSKAWFRYDQGSYSYDDRMPIVRSYSDALPDELIAVLGEEAANVARYEKEQRKAAGLKHGKGTTNWMSREAFDAPRSATEMAVALLHRIAFPDGEPTGGIAGGEWWVQTRSTSENIGLVLWARGNNGRRAAESADQVPWRVGAPAVHPPPPRPCAPAAALPLAAPLVRRLRPAPWRFARPRRLPLRQGRGHGVGGVVDEDARTLHGHLSHRHRRAHHGAQSGRPLPPPWAPGAHRRGNCEPSARRKRVRAVRSASLCLGRPPSPRLPR